MTDTKNATPQQNQPERFTINQPQGLVGPLVYFNGFAVALGSSDITLILNVDNAPALTLKCSYTTAKSFGEKLGLAVKQLEQITNHVLMTSDEVHRAMIEQAEKGK